MEIGLRRKSGLLRLGRLQTKYPRTSGATGSRHYMPHHPAGPFYAPIRPYGYTMSRFDLLFVLFWMIFLPFLSREVSLCRDAFMIKT